jgi:hypothetical protein
MDAVSEVFSTFEREGSSHTLSRLMRRVAGVIALAVCVALFGCHSFGSMGIDPKDRNFAGLQAILQDLPPGGTLDIFLVHGMRADVPQLYSAEIAAIASRLGLVAEVSGASGSSSPESKQLVAEVPRVTLDGISVFDASNWDTYRPSYSIVSLSKVSKDGVKHVNFYRFEYWQALAYMKCRFVIAPDTRVIGDSSRSRYCHQSPYNEIGGQRLSTAPDLGNRSVKTEIMEWGLADASIATSAYRTVLRQAVSEMLTQALQQARTNEGLSEDPGEVTPQQEIQRLADSGKTRVAFVSESLGSYVIHDTLAQSLSDSEGLQRKRGAGEALDPKVRTRTIAPIVIVCGTSQVHMFANQLALLRFSELAVSWPASGTPSSGAPVSNAAREDSARRSHFFRGCPASTGSSGGAVKFAAQQVVAYHEPNDLLTYYASDRPGSVGADNVNTTNVVIPYTTQWIWFLLADPIEAHVGQPTKPQVMDLVVCGHTAGIKHPCTSP